VHAESEFMVTRGLGYRSGGQTAARTQDWGTNMTAHGLSLSSGSWANEADKEIKGGIIASGSRGCVCSFITQRTRQCLLTV